jgi:SAM-dependent methyltransferase
MTRLAWLILAACSAAPVSRTPAPAPEPVPAPAPVSAQAEPVPEPAPAPEPAPPPPCPPNRDRDPIQKPAHVLALAGITDAMSVVDIGAGDGYFLCHLSRAVGPLGRVVSTDIEPALVRGLGERIAREQLANATAVQAPAADVGVAAASADRVLLVNVWHHLPDRRRYAKRIAHVLRPGGKVVVFDFKPRGNGHGIAPERVVAELTAGGFDAAIVPDELADQFVVVGTPRP